MIIRTEEDLVRNTPNKNQDDLIKRVFDYAEANGGVHYINFSEGTVNILSKDGTRKLIAYSDFGYSKVNLNKTILSGKVLTYEFPMRIKMEAMRRGYVYMPHMRAAVAYSGTYTTNDDGLSYSSDSSTGNYFVGVEVCSQEYYKQTQQPPLKQL